MSGSAWPSVRFDRGVPERGHAPPVAGTGDDTVSTQFAASQSNVLVAQTLEESELTARHQTVTAADIATARQEYESQVEAASTQVTSPCGLTGTALVDKLPKAFVDQQASSLAAQEKLEEVVGPRRRRRRRRCAPITTPTRATVDASCA